MNPYKLSARVYPAVQSISQKISVQEGWQEMVHRLAIMLHQAIVKAGDLSAEIRVDTVLVDIIKFCFISLNHLPEQNVVCEQQQKIKVVPNSQK